MERLTKFTVTVCIAVTLGTVTGAYVINFLTPALMLWLLYFVIANKLVNAYKEIKDKEKREYFKKEFEKIL